jgi:hypothetical protein
MPENIMPEIVISVVAWLGNFIRTHREEILAVATAIIALYTIILAWVVRRQNKDSRIIRRAYVIADMDGVRDTSRGNLVGHIIFRNAGHLPASKFSWFVKISSGNERFTPAKIRNKRLERVGVLPAGAKWPMGSDENPFPQEESNPQYLYVWGKVGYKDGFRWRKRYVTFCHRYPMAKSYTPSGGGFCIDAEHGRYNERGNDAN